MTAAELRRALTRLGLSQSEAAQRLGVTQPAVSGWARGQYAVPGPVQAAVTAWLQYGLPD
jgi:transcriptional regulator with XRE-family HTH domain